MRLPSNHKWTAGDIFWRRDRPGIRLVLSNEGGTVTYVRLPDLECDQYGEQYLTDEMNQKDPSGILNRWHSIYLGNHQDMLKNFILGAAVTDFGNSKCRDPFGPEKRTDPLNPHDPTNHPPLGPNPNS